VPGKTGTEEDAAKPYVDLLSWRRSARQASLDLVVQEKKMFTK